MTKSVCWHPHVLKRKDGHVLRRALDFKVKDKRKRGKQKQTWKKQVEEEDMEVGLSMEHSLCQ